MHLLKENYNKDLTPGNDDDIMDLIEDLEDEVEEEELNQEWLEENADELEESMVYLMLD